MTGNNAWAHVFFLRDRWSFDKGVRIQLFNKNKKTLAPCFTFIVCSTPCLLSNSTCLQEGEEENKKLIDIYIYLNENKIKHALANSRKKWTRKPRPPSRRDPKPRVIPALPPYRSPHTPSPFHYRLTCCDIRQSGTQREREIAYCGCKIFNRVSLISGRSVVSLGETRTRSLSTRSVSNSLQIIRFLK